MSTTGQKRRGKHEFVWDGRGERGDDARYSIIPGRAADDLSLTAVHFRLLAFMGRFNQKKGWCRLNQSELAERLGMRRGSLNRAVAELVQQRYIEKRSQRESRESFCLYRVVIDERDVGECAEEGAEQPADQGGTSQPGGVSSVGDTRVTSQVTPVSPLRTPNSYRSIDHIDKTEEQINSPNRGTDGASGERLPFTQAVLREIELLGLDPGSIVRRYQARTKGRRIADPNAYLLTMARDEVAKRTGVSAEILKGVASSDIRTRTAAVVATVISSSRPPAKPSAALIAHLRPTFGIRGLPK